VSGGEHVTGRQPCSDEWRVIRAMTHDAVLAAARDGRQHLTFHGFRIEARRVEGETLTGDLIEVRMSVGGEGCPLDCELIQTVRSSFGTAFAPFPASPPTPSTGGFAVCVSCGRGLH
jgi:hypothetical protein